MHGAAGNRVGPIHRREFGRRDQCRSCFSVRCSPFVFLVRCAEWDLNCSSASPRLMPEGGSLLAQSHDRVDSGGTARGEVGRGDRGQRQDR